MRCCFWPAAAGKDAMFGVHHMSTYKLRTYEDRYYRIIDVYDMVMWLRAGGICKHPAGYQ